MSRPANGDAAAQVAEAAVAQPDPLPETQRRVRDESAALLISVAAVDERPLEVLGYLSALLQQGKADRVTVMSLLNCLITLTSAVPGRACRPCSLRMVNSAVSTDGSGKPANGRSLMKVVALGVKKGHRLRFTASGEDAR
jgi:phosphocarrier protein FPr